MPREATEWRWYKGLGFRVLALLTLALLPIGVIALVQTRAQTEAMDEQSEAALLGIAETAARNEQRALNQGFGAADALGPVLLRIRDSEEACRALLGDFLRSKPVYSFIGFVPPSGVTSCTSNGGSFDLSGSPFFQSESVRRAPNVLVNTLPRLSDGPVLIVSQAVHLDGEFGGLVTLSIPHRTLQAAEPSEGDVHPNEVLTFNLSGDLLTAEKGLDGASGSLPAGMTPTDLIAMPDRVFPGRNARGESRVFATTPIVPGIVYAMAAWDPARPIASGFAPGFPPSAFPILMWIACLVVAYFAIDRLAIRHIRELGKDIRTFAADRRVPRFDVSPSLSSELVSIERSFHSMAEDIIYDEAKLEGAIKEKEILLKEVHHRVKNNMQLISSMVNMHLRKTKNPEVRAPLLRLQDRVQSLATVHRALYQSDDMSSVNASDFVRDLVNQTARMFHRPDARIDLDLDLEPISLYPDQALPLSLLLTEASVNAFKYGGEADGGGRWVRVRLYQSEPGEATLEVSNSTAAPGSRANAEAEALSTGFGHQLIQAFAAQLRARMTTEAENGVHRITLTFSVEDFHPEDEAAA